MRMPIRTTKSQDSMSLKIKSHYESRIIKILIGEEEAMFKVNEGFLGGTSFFAQHGPPKYQRNEPRGPPTPRSETRDSTPPNQSVMFFDRSPTVPTIESNKEVIDITDADADYVLKGRFFYSRDAFNIFVRHLNEAVPQAPTNQQGCQALFRAYALAAQYHVPSLQNQVIDALQKFYAQNTIPITDVTFIIRHWGDLVQEHLVAYLIAQTGYEMATGWAKYRADNPELEGLLATGNKVILEQLWQASMQYAKPSPAADPAKRKRDWRFEN